MSPHCVYIYDGPFEQGEGGWPLVRQAGLAYAQENGLNYPVWEAEIRREKKGKPFFPDLPLEFSLSHSGRLWMCIFGKSPCGLDLQQVKDCRYEEIAQKHFTTQEQRYVQLWGQEGFFDVWVRKEAFCKCTGQGFFSSMPSVVDENAECLSHLIWKEKVYYLAGVEISPDIKCAVCLTRLEPIEMRILG